MQPTIIQPNLAQARAHLAALDPSPGAMFGFRAIGETVDGFRGGVLAHGTLNRGVRQSSNHEKHGKVCCPERLLTFMQRQGAGVFVVPNFLDGAGQREANVPAIRTVFIDCDTQQAVVQAAEFIARTGLTPSITVASGGTDAGTDKFHHYWRVVGCPVARFREAASLLVSRTGADPACVDPSRVLRLAGFYHLKGAPRLTRIVSESNATYAFDDFLARVAGQPAVQPMNLPYRPGPAAGSVARSTSAPAERLRLHLDRRGGLIIPAVKATIAETQHGERHLTLRAIVARLIQLGWPDADVVALVVPTSLAAWPDVVASELQARVADQLRWVRERETKKFAAMPSASAQLARAFGVRA